MLLAAIVLAASGCVNRETNDNKNAAIPTQQLTEQPTLAPTEQPTLAPTGQPTQTDPELTYEDILEIKEKVFLETDKAYYYDSLSQAFGQDSVAAKVEILSTEYYYGWTKNDDSFISLNGWTIIQVRVLEVKNELNAVGAKPGDVLQMRQKTRICFAREEEKYAFFSEKHNTTINNADELDTLMHKKEGYFIITPEKYTEYKLMSYEDEYPLKVGEKYTMLCYIYNDVSEYGMPYSFFSYAYPVNSDMDIAVFAEKYRFNLTDEYITVSKQLAALFRHTEHIGESMIK